MAAQDRTADQRVVVTGLGALTPLGNSIDEYWNGLVEGRSGIEYIESFDASEFPCVVAGEVRNFDASEYMPAKQVRRLARFSQLAVAASRQAVDDAGIDLETADVERIGVLLGNGIGSYPDTEEQSKVFYERGWSKVSPLYMSKMLPNMAAANVAMALGLVGYNNTVITACAAGTQAIGDAADMIRAGRADIIISGGSESSICAQGLAAFCAMRALSQRKDDPHGASRPFDTDRDGFVPTEAAGILVLESLSHAQERGATIYAEVAGYGASSDAFDFVQPRDDGAGAARTMRWALDNAGIDPSEVSYINAHGTSTPLGDAAETTAIKAVFGDRAYQIPVSSTKSMIGHALGAAGGVEAIAVVKSIQTGAIHPTINLQSPDPACDLDYVPNEARDADVRVALSNSFGFGGQNACVVFTKME